MALDELRELLTLLKEFKVTSYSDKSVNITLAQEIDAGPDGLTEIPVLLGDLEVDEIN